MSLRDSMPKARTSRTHYFLTFARGDNLRCFAIRPWVLYALIGVAPLVLCAYLGATMYLVYRDDMLAGLMSRQNEMQYAYEDRLAAMRAQIDRITGRQLLDQNTLEGRVHELLSRQAQLESRATMISALAKQAGVSPETTSSIPRAIDARAAISRGLGQTAVTAPTLPPGAAAFAPMAPTPRPGAFEKPRPEAPEQHGALERADETLASVAANPDMPVETRLQTLSGNLRKIEASQVAAVDAFGASARRSVERLRGVLRDAGMSQDRLANVASAANKGMGGPFVPMKVDPKGSLFEREVDRLQTDFAMASELGRVVKRAPLRKPLTMLEVTSPFGARVDPFFGRLATHTGVDLREATGAPARATAAGKVVSAGWAGGYGNMVEIDHGGGYTTRYGHLSSIAVEPGQMVDARDIIGRVGSTGRSTGSHLHYEVRVDGEPVDPMRLLRAGDKLAASD